MADVDVQRPVEPGPCIARGAAEQRGLESPWPGAAAEAQREGRWEAHTFQLRDHVQTGMLPSI